MRWNHPDLGDVSPGEFIPIAESTGIIFQLGEWMVREAVGTASRWLKSGHPTVIAVNISPIQFRHHQFIQMLDRALSEWELPGKHLEIEVTESIAMGDPLAAQRIIRELGTRGIKAVIDDFGTGYSSMSYLSRLGFHQLKIDQSFVCNIGRDPSDEAIIVAIIKLARELGMQVLAEGVETLQQRAFLMEHGCDLIQGWLVAKAMPAGEAAGWLSASIDFSTENAALHGSPKS